MPHRYGRTLPALLLVLASAAPAEKARKPSTPLSAETYPFHDRHANEHVTVAAEPGDTKETRPDTRLDYFRHGYLPVRVIVTNDGDQPIVLDDARILFIASDNSVANAATDEDLQRRLFALKNVRGTKIPLPSPLPSITVHHKPVDKKITADDQDFGFKSTTVAPHTTAAGYLYYDVRDLDAPILNHASIEVRKLRFGSTNKSLDSFEIPLQEAASRKQ